jgi:hypothetical protein
MGFKETMTDVVSVVNFIRQHGKNHTQFNMFLDETEYEYGGTAYCCEVH